MNPIVRNGLAVLAGIVVGSVVNMALIYLGPLLIPPPEGADVTSMEGLEASIHLFEAKHFVFPFLAHALGTLVGALLAAWLAASRAGGMALMVGLVFLVGGVLNAWMLPAPAWFEWLDVLFAYLPMALLGAWLAPRRASHD
ncbi:hypothetical protein [Wenzhouxiangella marina]|uniref:Signal peptide protein n=1 Tax=Wenzhouxiangella marina TaxID=1579979 RepID=A0A0K0Y0C6_9GAMM|nr:hypothetical protein [Wenzhouxiangella marina]AKS43389.1 signal peptide protein [Wenzhouxiangella marina]MBB6088495.1 polyferredoxin [Wenzhouxiangella marina]